MGRSGGTMVCGMFCVLYMGAGLCCSGRFAIPCGGCSGYSWTDRTGLPAVGTPSATPSDWVGVHPEFCWTLRAAKHFTCLQEASGNSLLAFGLLFVCFWTSWGLLWFRPWRDGVIPHAHKKCLSSSGSVTSNITQRAATHHARKNHAVVDLHEKSCSLLMSAVCWCGAVLLCVSCQSRAITMVVLPFWLRTLCTKVFS